MDDLHFTNETSQSGLGAFLRSRRERLSPESVGLRPGFRRRVCGLRREEVAQLAGVSTTWYTWLEQGRDVRPSVDLLTALADVLKLDATERRHLFLLNQDTARINAGSEVVPSPLHRMLAGLTGQPAYVLGRRWDVLAWNPAAVALFGDYGRLKGDARNIMHLVFANQEHRQLLVDWESVASTALATFRVDADRYAGDSAFARLIATLLRTSSEFRRWWPRHDIVGNFANPKRILHPLAGPMTFEYTSFPVLDHPDMRLVVYTPLEQSDSARKLEALLRSR